MSLRMSGWTKVHPALKCCNRALDAIDRYPIKTPVAPGLGRWLQRVAHRAEFQVTQRIHCDQEFMRSLASNS